MPQATTGSAPDLSLSPDPAVLAAAATEAVTLLKLLANQDRLLLLCELSQGELCVSDLEQRVGVRQPTLSQQLAALRSAGVVATRRESQRIFYSVADPACIEILAVLYRLYCQRAMG